MINTIYLVSRLIKCGPTNQALNLLSGFDKRQVNAIIVTLSEEDFISTMYEKFVEEGIEVVQLKRNRWNMIGALCDLARLVEKRNIEIVHSSGLRSDILNILLWSKKVKKCTTQRCDPQDILNFYSSRFIGLLYTVGVIRRFQRIIACSEALSQILLKKYHLDSTFVCNGVDAIVYAPVSKEEKKALRNQYALPQDRCVYIVLGSLIPRKNVEHIIQAFKMLNDTTRHLLIVGGGPLQEHLKDLSIELSITFTGNINDPLPYIQLSDIMVSASLAEVLPNSVLESLACGLPVLLSDITPHQEIYNRNQNIGELFSNDNMESLVEAIRKTDYWNLDEKKQIARDIVENNFNKYITAKAYEKQYLSLLKK